MTRQGISQALGAASKRPSVKDKPQADQPRMRPSPMWKPVGSAFGKDKAEDRSLACRVKPRSQVLEGCNAACSVHHPRRHPMGKIRLSRRHVRDGHRQFLRFPVLRKVAIGAGAIRRQRRFRRFGAVDQRAH